MSISRTGSGMFASRAVARSQMHWASGPVGSSSALMAEPRMTGILSPGKPYFDEELADLELDEVEELGVLHQVALVEEDDHRRDVDLPGEEDVLLRLRHRAVRRRRRRGSRRPSAPRP